MFDAGAPCPKSKLSLNDNILDHPRINNNLCAIEMAVRFYSILILADIWKLYLQVKLKPEFHDFLRFLWKDPDTMEDKIYCFRTLIWGVKDSGFQAINVINILIDMAKKDMELKKDPCFTEKLGKQQGDEERLKKVKHSFYVDDLALSVPSVEEGRRIIEILQSVLGEGSLILKKFISNSSKLLETIPADLREETEEIEIDRNIIGHDGSIISKESTLLGYSYRPKNDVYIFEKYADMPSAYSWPLSKIDLASIIPKIYDPIGICSAFVLRLKFIMRNINEQKLEWTDTTEKITDENTRKAIENDLKSCLNEFQYFKKYKVPRHVHACPNGNSYILIFVDASDLGIGVSVYIVTKKSPQKFTSNLLRSTADLVPKPSSLTAKISIPKKELCALKRGVEHYSFILEHLVNTDVVKIKKERIVILSDSKVALAWLTKDPKKLVPFCKTKVTYIQKRIKEDNLMFYYVNTKDNLADLTSRSMKLQEMICDERFLHGDAWMRDDFENYNIQRYDQLTYSDIDYTEGIQKKYSLSLNFQSKIVNADNDDTENYGHHNEISILNRLYTNRFIESFFTGIRKIYCFAVSKRKSQDTYNPVINLDSIVPAIEYYESLGKILNFTGWIIFAVEKFRKGLFYETKRDNPHKYRRLKPYATSYYKGSSFPKSFKTVELPFIYKQRALLFYIIESQKELFLEEYQTVQQKRQVKLSSPLSGLNPFIDEYGVMRVGSRLEYLPAHIVNVNRQPIILGDAILTIKLIKMIHEEDNNHYPLNRLKQKLSQEYYILKQHTLAKRVIKNCLRCKRFSCKFTHQQMGNVLSKYFNNNVTLEAFKYVGVDCTGSFPMTTVTKSDLVRQKLVEHKYNYKKTRLKTRQYELQKEYLGGFEPDEFKAYLVVFICFLTRSIRIEVACDASTQSFLMAFNNFCSICGTPSVMFSDQAPIFKKSEKILRDSLSRDNEERIAIFDKLKSYANAKGIEWLYTTQYHSWTAATWESRMQAIKKHIYKQTSNRKLSFPELQYIANSCSCILNNTPIAAGYTGSNIELLTPSMLAIGRCVEQFPITPEKMFPEELRDAEMARQFKIRNEITNEFFKEFMEVYFGRLHDRPKWKRPRQFFNIGDIVLVKPQNLKFKKQRYKYFMGQVQGINYGRDQVPRTYLVFIGQRRFNKNFHPKKDSVKVYSHAELSLLTPVEQLQGPEQ